MTSPIRMVYNARSEFGCQLPAIVQGFRLKGECVSSLTYPVCAIDLDDTLLNSGHAISERNVAAVRAAVRRGVRILLASGRMHQAAMPYVEQLGLTSPVISYNGAMVRCPDGETWFHRQIVSQLAEQILQYCGEHRLQLNYYLDDHLYTAAYTPWMQLYHGRTGAPVEVRDDFYTALAGTSPTKLIIVDAPECTDRLLGLFRARFGTRLYITKSNDEYLEFMPPDANKGAALELTVERLGYSSAGTAAIGDSFNDLPMLQWAGLSMAVSNAKPSVREIVRRILPSNDEDGVAFALGELYGV